MIHMQPGKGAENQVQTSRYYGVDLSRSSQLHRHSRQLSCHHCEHPQNCALPRGITSLLLPAITVNTRSTMHCPEAYTSIILVPPAKRRGTSQRDSSQGASSRAEGHMCAQVGPAVEPAGLDVTCPHTGCMGAWGMPRVVGWMCVCAFCECGCVCAFCVCDLVVGCGGGE